MMDIVAASIHACSHARCIAARREVLALYGRATNVDSSSYHAWHQWGLSNYRAIQEAREQSK